jgi:hypothetical protein
LVQVPAARVLGNGLRGWGWIHWTCLEEEKETGMFEDVSFWQLKQQGGLVCQQMPEVESQ